MKDKTAIVVSPMFATAKEAADWLDMLHWSHTSEDEGIIFGIKKQTNEDGKTEFCVIEFCRN